LRLITSEDVQMEKPLSNRHIGLRLTEEEQRQLRMLAAGQNTTMAGLAAREVRRYLFDRSVTRGPEISEEPGRR
jgi:hypothetical protein